MSYMHLNLIGGRVIPSKVSRASPTALKRRLEHQRYVIALGVTPDVLAEIVDEFYKRIRSHALLGPLFEERIGDNWEAHLKKMKAFWISIALNAGSYSGKPAAVHKTLNNITTQHFDIWLNLFRQTAKDITKSNAATSFLNERAEKMALSFQKNMGLTHAVKS